MHIYCTVHAVSRFMDLSAACARSAYMTLYMYRNPSQWQAVDLQREHGLEVEYSTTEITLKPPLKVASGDHRSGVIIFSKMKF